MDILLPIVTWALEHKIQLFTVPVTLAAAKLAPVRVGIGRALFLAAKSKIRGAPVNSSRSADVQSIQKVVNDEPGTSGNFIIVSGPKGIGKTCAIETALAYRFGVVFVDVPSGTSTDTILRSTHKKVSGIPYETVDFEPSAARVARWHSLFFRQPITVVLKAAEVTFGKQYAEIIPAARLLTDIGLQVLIDASDNSINPVGKPTKREQIIAMEPMSRDVLESIPELADVIKALKAANLFDLVWLCFGGVPADYITNLRRPWVRQGRTDIRSVVETSVRKELSTAIRTIAQFTDENPQHVKLLEMFQSESQVPQSALAVMGVPELPLEPTYKVFRITDSPLSSDEEEIIIPASSAIALALKYQWKKPPSLNKLLEITSKKEVEPTSKKEVEPTSKKELETTSKKEL